MTTIPTLQELYEDILADLEGEFNVTIDDEGKAWLRAQAAVQAAKLKQFYLAIGFVQKQLVPDAANAEAKGGTLERHGELKLGHRPFPAGQGIYEVEVTGTIGATINALTTWKSDDDSTSPGKQFILDEDFQLLTNPDVITIRALEAGTDSALQVGDTLTANQPINGVDKGAEVTAETTPPQDAEDLEDYRADVLQAYRLEPQGGAAGDYRLWAADVSGLAQAYAYPKSGASAEVDLFIEATIAASSDSKGSAGGPMLAEVEEVIELDPDTTLSIEERGRRPLGVFAVNVQSVTPLDVDITVNGYQNLTTDKETLIEDALGELLDSIRPFVAGADVVANRNDTLSHNNIIQAILNAVPGSIFTSITLEVDGNVVSSYQFTDGDIPFFNDLTI